MCSFTFLSPFTISQEIMSSGLSTVISSFAWFPCRFWKKTMCNFDQEMGLFSLSWCLKTCTLCWSITPTIPHLGLFPSVIVVWDNVYDWVQQVVHFLIFPHVYECQYLELIQQNPRMICQRQANKRIWKRKRWCQWEQYVISSTAQMHHVQ